MSSEVLRWFDGLGHEEAQKFKQGLCGLIRKFFDLDSDNTMNKYRYNKDGSKLWLKRISRQAKDWIRTKACYSRTSRISKDKNYGYAYKANFSDRFCELVGDEPN